MMSVSIVFKSECLCRVALLVNDGGEVVIICVLFFFVFDSVVEFVTVLIIEGYIVPIFFVLKL